MREIKFRAWDRLSNRMREVKDIISMSEHGFGTRFKDQEDEFDYTGGSYVNLMQYTGLKDKNGKEIYEGDIISITEVDEDSAFGSENTDAVEVKWINEVAQWRAVFKSGRRTELHLSVSLPTVIDCKVIGNIYEYPELIK